VPLAICSRTVVDLRWVGRVEQGGRLLGSGYRGRGFERLSGDRLDGCGRARDTPRRHGRRGTWRGGGVGFGFGGRRQTPEPVILFDGLVAHAAQRRPDRRSARIHREIHERDQDGHDDEREEQGAEGVAALYNRQLPMSRVVYNKTTSTDAQLALRDEHRLRVVTADEEGAGADALPDGVYGFTYSPGLKAAPLFAAKRFRNYETHKRFDGETYLLGFVTEAEGAEIEAGAGTVSVEVYPDPTGTATTLVALPYGRIKQNRQHAAPNQDSFSATIVPG